MDTRPDLGFHVCYKGNIGRLPCGKIDAFDLAQNDDTHVGHWAFDVAQTRQAWYGLASLYTYVFKCPWQKAPEHEGLTIRVKFTDTLTGRVFTAQREVQIKRPQPASL